MNSDERCRNCGYPIDAHDWDGACPMCDDDAELFTLENRMSESTPAPDPTRLANASTWESAMLLAGLATAPPHVRYRALSRLGKLMRMWPVPQCCEPHREIALAMLTTYYDDAHAGTN